MHRSHGFSLVELMIVVGIIGILAALATPRFLTFRARSLQAEAKTSLSAVFRTERVWLEEHSTYTDNLKNLGWAPEGSPVYLVGFTSDGTPSASSVNDSAELKGSSGSTYSTDKMVDAFGVPLTQAELPQATVTTTSFTVGAVGNLDGDGRLDQWTINDGNVLDNILNDATGE